MQYYTCYKCPIGNIRLRASEEGLVAVEHVNQQSYTGSTWKDIAGYPILKQAMGELDAYFLGELMEFGTSLAPEGTDFQLAVWQALQEIPYGTTATYSDIAQSIGRPKAVRAVGAANGRNPLSIFIPCHRIIGKSGKLVGYAGGLKVKQMLLAIESKKSANGEGLIFHGG